MVAVHGTTLMTTSKLLLITGALFTCQLSFCQQQSSFRRLGVNDGLSQNSVREIFQDRQGFIWIGTGDGLNRYDGRQIKKYRESFRDKSADARAACPRAACRRCPRLPAAPASPGTFRRDRTCRGSRNRLARRPRALAPPVFHPPARDSGAAQASRSTPECPGTRLRAA